MNKRIFDIIFSFLILVLLVPVIILLAIFVRISMGSPVFFSQKRPGLNSDPFILFKFRTMKDLADAKGAPLKDCHRLTEFGKLMRKLSLDELPSLLNVLKGDMSFVGPRPLLVEYLRLYSEKQARRHDVKPGITGWAQVNGRNSISWDEKLKLDVWYVDNYSFWLDLKILWMTIIKVIVREGISQDGHATMPAFKGCDSDDDKGS